MIEINSTDPKRPAFLLTAKNSHYLMNVDEQGLLRHRAWGPSGQPAAMEAWATDMNPPGIFANEANYQEIYCFGETTSALPSLIVSLDADCGLPVSTEEAPNFPARDLQLAYSSHQIHPSAEPAGAPAHGRAAKKAKPETLEIVLRDRAVNIELSLFYRCYEECDMIERWCELRNNTPGTIEVDRMAFASWSLPLGDYRVSTPTGQIFGEFQMQTVDLPRGLTLTTRSGNLITGHRANPAVLLEDQTDPQRTFFAALAYSGNWRIDVESLDAGCVRIHGGEDDIDTRFSLNPGETHRTHAFFAGCTAKGKTDAAQKLHALQRDYLQINHGQHLVLYNSWEATEFDLSSEQQMKLADKAAAIGVELFVVDDGWFGGRRNDRAGLGDWQVSPEVFPDGLMPLIDHVHSLGMKFGIWFEPEMVNPDSDLYRAHPDWVLHVPGRDRTLQRHQLILDFGRPEVVDYIESQLTAFLDEHPIDFIKWDMNRLAHPAGSAAGRAIWRKHVQGVYRIMDALRKRYPELSLQSCASGGGRVDLGMAQRVEQFWASDNTDAFHRIRTQDTFAQFYAPNAMECWVTHSPNPQTKRPAPLESRFAVAMRGVLGIGTDLSKLDEEELAACASHIAFYKKVRPLVQEETCHILARPNEQNCSAWWFVNESGEEGFLSSVLTEHKPGHTVPRLRLPGLQRDTLYSITLPDGSELPPRSGAELEDHGIFGADKPSAVLGPYPGATRLLHLTAIRKDLQ
jgi:alpha-galactosidase